jgi:hypothetical protein
MRQLILICAAFAAGSAISNLIVGVHAQSSPGAGALSLQAAPRTSAVLSPAAFVLDSESRRLTVCWASSPGGPGPTCSGWTDLAK